jgi:hypothetical protein
MAHAIWVWALFWWASTVFSALVIFNIAASLLYPIVYPMGRRVGDAKIDNYLVVVVTVGTPSVLPSLREVVDNLERLGLRFVIVSWNPLPLEGVDVLLVPWEGGGTKYGAIRWFVKSYA